MLTLSRSEKKVLRAFQSDSTPFNEPVRLLDKEPDPTLMSALKKFPDYVGLAVRGANHDDAFVEDLKKTGVYHSKSFFSSSRGQLCHRFMDDNCRFYVQSKTGKPIYLKGKPSFDDEREVLFLAGTSFRVDKIEWNDSEQKWEIYMEEMDP